MMRPPTFGIWISKPENGASLPQVFTSASGFLHVFIFHVDGCVRETGMIFSWSRDFGEMELAEIFRLVLTNFFYLSNIRPVSWGVQWNGRDLTMYRCYALQIRRARDASTGRTALVCSRE